MATPLTLPGSNLRIGAVHGTEGFTPTQLFNVEGWFSRELLIPTVIMQII